MPYTPFHFGPGLTIKGVASPVFSWFAFVAAQVLIDCETLYYLLHHTYPIHRFFHSFLGASLAGLVAAVLWFLFVTVAGQVWPAGVNKQTQPRIVRTELSLPSILVGGLVGGITHTFLDSIMHPDLRPFMPFSNYNPFLGLVGDGTLYDACVVAGIVGLILVLRSLRAQRDVPVR